MDTSEFRISPLTYLSKGKFMILRGGRLTHADMVGLDDFKTTLKRGIDVMLLSKKVGTNSSPPLVPHMTRKSKSKSPLDGFQ